MSIRSFLTKALGVVTDTGTKAVTGVVKDVSGTAKDVVDIRKGLVETKIAQIKVEEYESQIQKATLEDVKKYDPRIKTLLDEILGNVHPSMSNCGTNLMEVFLTTFPGIIKSDKTRKRLGSIRLHTSGL